VLVVVLGAIMAFFANEYSLTANSVRSIAGFLPVVAIPAFVIGFLADALADPLDNQLKITVLFVVAVIVSVLWNRIKGIYEEEVIRA
jgi:hypothetical protein